MPCLPEAAKRPAIITALGGCPRDISLASVSITVDTCSHVLGDQRARGVRAQMRTYFLQDLYGYRALVESIFLAVKRKLSARVPGRSLAT